MSFDTATFTPLPRSVLNDYNEDKLIGDYTLQLVSIRDISIPQYNQENEFLRIDEEEEEGEDDEPMKANKKGAKQKQPNNQTIKHRGPRMLCLNLSDGKNIVKGIEYRPILTLKPDLPIGSKILIKGPIDVSFKVLLLQAHNIRVLGSPSPAKEPPKQPNPSVKPKVEPIVNSPPSTQSCKKEMSKFFTSKPIKEEIKEEKIAADESIIDLSNTLDEQMYYIDGLDDEILE